MPKTFEDYAASLEKLVGIAREAIIAGNDPQLKVSHSNLGAFIADSDDRIPGVIELDNIASNAMRDVTLARLDQSLVKNLSERSAEIARLIKSISTQSAANVSAASTLRLERIQSLIQASMKAVDELKKFSDSVDPSTSDGKKILKVVSDAIQAVTAVQKQVVT